MNSSFHYYKEHKQPESPKKSGDKKDGPNMIPPKPTNPMKTVLVWVAVIATIIIALKIMDPASGNKATLLEYSQFLKLLDTSKDDIKKAEIVQKGGGLIASSILYGEVKDVKVLQAVIGEKEEVELPKFRVNLPFIDSEMLEIWDKEGFSYTFKEKEATAGDFLLNWWPFFLLIGFWIFMFRNGPGGQKGMFSFGKSRAKLQNMDNPQNTFQDVAGAEEAKEELAEIIDFLKAPDKYRKLGGKIPKGVLLLGPPGTGKTLLARAVAGEAGVPFFSMSGSDFVEMFVGVGASRVRDLFENAKKNSPCIIFIDEIDAVGRQRGAGLGGGHDEREQTLNQMLVEMDGFESNSGIILIAATNRPDVLDPALLRPGRFDRQVVVDAPDVKGREGILEVHTKDVPIGDDVDLKTIAKGTPGFVGADLANLVNEAALMAARYNQDRVTMLDFEEAKDKIGMGTERRSMVLTEKERRETAYHEAGHAICNIYCTKADPLHKVTIIPRGRALGITFSLPEEDRKNWTKDFIEDQICIYMGGRVAEKLVFNEVTSGASSDIKGATDMARRMICDFGMTDLGPIAFGKKDEQVFLGREINNHRDFSEQTAEQIDSLMKEIIIKQEKRAHDLLIEHRSELDLLAEALVEHELLDREEINIVLSGEKLEQAKKSRKTKEFQQRKEVTDLTKEALSESEMGDKEPSDTLGETVDSQA